MWGRSRAQSGRKFGNKPAGGFASKLENAVHDLLQLREKAGEISDIKCQVQVHLTRAKILYKPDFSFFDKSSGETVYCESKGYETAVWAIKRRLWAKYGPGKLEIYKGSYHRPILSEAVIPDLGKIELVYFHG